MCVLTCWEAYNGGLGGHGWLRPVGVCGGRIPLPTCVCLPVLAVEALAGALPARGDQIWRVGLPLVVVLLWCCGWPAPMNVHWVKTLPGSSGPAAVAQSTEGIVEVPVHRGRLGQKTYSCAFYLRCWRLWMSRSFLKASLEHFYSPSPVILTKVAHS
jgi:hypothetical protein